MSLDKNILNRYNQGNVSEEERSTVESWFDQYHGEGPLSDQEVLDMLSSLDKKVFPVSERKSIPWNRIIAVAASLILVLTISYYWMKSKSNNNIEDQLAQYEAPKSSSPIIVLENNQEYNIDSLHAGDTLNVGKYFITKLEDGEIKYILDPTTTEIVYNTVRTKVGSTASLMLSDGSRVWLNVNSEIKYPINFSSDTREVQLKGEGYFEVEHQEHELRRIPFYVRGNTYTIAVLGTKFNVDFTKSNVTALVDGKVSIAKGDLNDQVRDLDFNVTLLPNQVYSEGGVSYSDNILQYLDWKEGYFSLSNRTLGSVVQKISAWYGIKVIVDDSIKNSLLYGRINRKKSLKEVLSLISDAIPLTYEFDKNVLYLKKATQP
ncbi:FecR family protein [Sphingobacterium hotanense]|uniref:FecR family protein n=1 Tax=Sphingobacterium hotanense TaxID=649196 RepID=UPI0021A4DB01|nr:FecR family protein [Sphingobacterium hotanense]MCT1525280.1 FecR family protein [Sphingobacterium hotanense]